MFVCLGNICRSPLAHGMIEAMVDEAGLADMFKVSSSGTGAWHIGQPPERRMLRTAARHGYRLGGLRAQQFSPQDLEMCDHIYAMDRGNMRDILADVSRPDLKSKVELFRSYDPSGTGDVPDPYYDGRFEHVFDIVERTVRNLLRGLVLRYRPLRKEDSVNKRLRVSKIR